MNETAFHKFQDITDGHKILRSLEIIFDHLAFMAAGGFFRIATMVFLLTYLNAFAFVPIVCFWLINLAIGYRR